MRVQISLGFQMSKAHSLEEIYTTRARARTHTHTHTHTRYARHRHSTQNCTMINRFETRNRCRETWTQSMLPTACSKVAEFHSLQSQPVVKLLNPTACSKCLAVFNG
jgi:hypothetical protein